MGLINYVGSLFNDKPYDGFRPVGEMNALERFGHFYDSSMNPNYMDNYSRREENYYKTKQEEQAKIQNAEALKSLSTLAAQQYGLPEEQVYNMASQLSPDQALRALSLIQPPSDARMWQQYEAMTPEQKRDFNSMKRQQQIVDTGDKKGVIDPTNPSKFLAEYPQGVAPQTKITDEQIITTPAISGEQLQSGVPQLPMGALQQFDAQTPANAPAPTPPMNPMSNVQDLPPSPSKRRELEGNKIKSEKALKSAYTDSKNIDSIIDKTLKQASTMTTGIIGSVTKGIPSTSSFDLSENLKTIEADSAFSALQNMRDNSPTGGALGNVSERELELLSSAKAALSQSQSEAQFKENLLRYKNIRESSLNNVKQAYEQQYGVPFEFEDEQPEEDIKSKLKSKYGLE